jgi:hypothetical protein
MTPSQFLDRYKPFCFYHFTDTRNLASIAQLGLQPWSIIQSACAHPGGNQWSHDADIHKGLHGYVHLCLRAEHPMEFAAKQRGDIVESKFLLIDPAIVHRPGILFFSDVSNKTGVNGLTLEQAAEVMDFEVVYERTNWRDPAVQQRLKASKKYELLVPGPIAPSEIRGL